MTKEKLSEFTRKINRLHKLALVCVYGAIILAGVSLVAMQYKFATLNIENTELKQQLSLCKKGK